MENRDNLLSVLQKLRKDVAKKQKKGWGYGAWRAHIPLISTQYLYMLGSHDICSKLLLDLVFQAKSGTLFCHVL